MLHYQFSGFTDREWEAHQQKRYQRNTAPDDVFPHSRFFAGGLDGTSADDAGGHAVDNLGRFHLLPFLEKRGRTQSGPSEMTCVHRWGR